MRALLLVLPTLLTVIGLIKIWWGQSRGGRVAKLSRLADRQLRRADRASKRGRPVAAEGYYRMFQETMDQIEAINDGKQAG